MSIQDINEKIELTIQRRNKLLCEINLLKKQISILESELIGENILLEKQIEQMNKDIIGYKSEEGFDVNYPKTSRKKK